MLVLKSRSVWLVTLLMVFLVMVLRGGDDRQKPPPLPAPENKPSPYGEYLAWEDADQVFPRYAAATLIDFDTRLQFKVQRRAGDAHADVQPLTAEDTEVMKRIYNGHWSWKRRAVLVRLDNGRRIAASMHGMPHGAGAIRGNNFNGHFCVHFQGSTTHNSRRSDLSHQIMVWKAAGRVQKELQKTGAEQTIRVFFTALDQAEKTIPACLLYGKGKEEVLAGLGKLEYCTLESLKKTGPGTWRVKLRYAVKDKRQEIKREVDIITKKNQGVWKIRATGDGAAALAKLFSP